MPSWARPRCRPGPGLASRFSAIQTAVRRASELTNQLMAYSGQGRFVVEPTNLNDLISEMHPLPSAAIPKSVNLVIELAQTNEGSGVCGP